jgi:muramoyltetrapeptide carboxypeptidase
MIKVPAKLVAGDQVEVLVLSAPDAFYNREQFDKGIAYLKGIGFEVKYRENALGVHEYLVAPAKEQAAWIMDAFKNSETKGIFLANGGSNLNRVIQYLDFETIKNNPKIIMGMSNMSILLNAITTKCSLVTYYGPAVIFNLGNPDGLDPYTERSFINTVLNTDSKAVFEPFSQWQCLKPGVASGEIVGGNLTTIESLIGTPYEPRWDGAILFWEDCFMQIHSVDMVLSHFELAGIFKKISGMIIGRPLEIAETEDNPIDLTFEQFVQEYFSDITIPVMYNVDFGHNDEKQVIPIGKRVEINTKELTIREI